MNEYMFILCVLENLNVVVLRSIMVSFNFGSFCWTRVWWEWRV